MPEPTISDTQVIAAFDDLFAAAPAPESDPDPAPETDPPANDTPETDPKTDPETPPAAEGEDPPAAPPQPPSKESKLNYAMGQLRTERNEYENLIKQIGVQIGLDPKTPVNQIAEKVTDLLTQKASEKYNLPPELASVLVNANRLETENNLNNRYNTVKTQLQGMQQKFGYSPEAEDEFLQALLDKGVNPLDINSDPVDLEGEYLKLNFDNIIKQQRTEAEEAERARLEAAKNAPSAPPGSNPGSPDASKKLETVKDLDEFFNSLTNQ